MYSQFKGSFIQLFPLPQPRTFHFHPPCLLLIHSSTLHFSLFLSLCHHLSVWLWFVPLCSSPLLFSPLPVSHFFFHICSFSVILLLMLSPQFGKDLVSQTLSKTITTPPRRPLISPLNSPTPATIHPPRPSSQPSIYPSIATIPGLLLSHS